MKRGFAIIISLLLGLVGCTKIEDLSGDASLKSFSVLSHSPQSIILGEVKIAADTVYIPVDYGKYNFPLTLTVEPKVAAGVYIYGLSRSEEITFESIDDDAVRFVVSAENGMSRSYYIALQEKPLSESCALREDVTFRETQEDKSFFHHKLVNVNVGEEHECKMIVALNSHFPLTLTPLFSLDAGSHIASYSVEGTNNWKNFNNGDTPLTFNDAAERYTLEVVAPSGKSEQHTVGLSMVEYSKIDATMQIDYRQMSATPEQQGVVVDRIDIDFNSGEIIIVLEKDEENDIEFPIEFSLEIPVSEWLSHVGISKSQLLSFNSFDDKYPFALLYEDKMQATQWSISIAEGQSKSEQVTIESGSVSEFSCGKYTFIMTFNHLTQSSNRAEPEVYPHTREVLLHYSSFYEPILASSEIGNWWAEYDLSLTLNSGETITQNLRWEAAPKANGKVSQKEIRAAVAEVKYIDVKQNNGSTEQWAVKLAKDNVPLSAECDLLGFTITSTLPSYLDFKDPAYTFNKDAGEIYLHIGERYSFPMNVELECEISPYASLEGSTLHFEDEFAEQTIKITSQDGTSTRSYVARLIVPQESVAPAITEISFAEIALEGAALRGDVVIDAENCRVRVGVEATNAHFPLQIPLQSVTVADSGTLDLPSSGEITFASADNPAMVWVSSADGTARQLWSFEIVYYQQLEGGNMNRWEHNASPVTISKPWSTPNMNGIASVKNTTPVAGVSGAEGDYAAQMQTGTSWGQLASGSIFTGWFDKDNSTKYGLSDPVRLTHFGTPFSGDVPIKGISAKVSYLQSAKGVDWGSITVILIHEESTATFEFHGNKPNKSDDPTAGSAPHPNNTAREVALSRVILGNGSATKTSYGDDITMNVEPGEWVDIFIPISTTKPFTHISIAAASSAYGDYFIGQEGSTMRLDDVTIVY